MFQPVCATFNNLPNRAFLSLSQSPTSSFPRISEALSAPDFPLQELRRPLNSPPRISVASPQPKCVQPPRRFPQDSTMPITVMMGSPANRESTTAISRFAIIGYFLPYNLPFLKASRSNSMSGVSLNTIFSGKESSTA